MQIRCGSGLAARKGSSTSAGCGGGGGVIVGTIKRLTCARGGLGWGFAQAAGKPWEACVSMRGGVLRERSTPSNPVSPSETHGLPPFLDFSLTNLATTQSDSSNYFCFLSACLCGAPFRPGNNLLVSIITIFGPPDAEGVGSWEMVCPRSQSYLLRFL